MYQATFVYFFTGLENFSGFNKHLFASKKSFIFSGNFSENFKQKGVK